MTEQPKTSLKGKSIQIYTNRHIFNMYTIYTNICIYCWLFEREKGLTKSLYQYV